MKLSYQVTPSWVFSASILSTIHDICMYIFLDFSSRMAKLELASNLVLFHSLKLGKKKKKKNNHLTFLLLLTASPNFSWPKGKNLFAKRYLTFLPGMFIFPSCFHSILLQLTLISLQQFKDTGLLSHVTFISSFAKIRMGVTLSLFLDSYSKISNASLQLYSPAKNPQKHLLLLHTCITLEE